MIARLFAASAVLLYSLLAVASHPATEWARNEFSSYSAKIFGAALFVCQDSERLIPEIVQHIAERARTRFLSF